MGNPFFVLFGGFISLFVPDQVHSTGLVPTRERKQFLGVPSPGQ